jgi:hypothetical protein
MGLMYAHFQRLAEVLVLRYEFVDADCPALPLNLTVETRASGCSFFLLVHSGQTA